MKRRAAHPQLELPLRRRGGKRPGAGRKPKGERAGVRHAPRPRVTRHTPVHVTLRMHKFVASLRQAICYRALERALREGRARFGLRLVHFSIQSNHIHLLVEADDTHALSRGMQGLSVRIARTLNQQMMRRGPVLADRYDVRPIRARPACDPAQLPHWHLAGNDSATFHPQPSRRPAPPRSPAAAPASGSRSSSSAPS